MAIAWRRGPTPPGSSIRPPAHDGPPDEHKGRTESTAARSQRLTTLAAYRSYSGCFGRFTTFENNNPAFVLHNQQGTLRPGGENDATKRFYQFTGNVLRLGTPPTVNAAGETAGGHLYWEKIRPPSNTPMFSARAALVLTLLLQAGVARARKRHHRVRGSCSTKRITTFTRRCLALSILRSARDGRRLCRHDEQAAVQPPARLASTDILLIANPNGAISAVHRGRSRDSAKGRGRTLCSSRIPRKARWAAFTEAEQRRFGNGRRSVAPALSRMNGLITLIRSPTAATLLSECAPSPPPPGESIEGPPAAAVLLRLGATAWICCRRHTGPSEPAVAGVRDFNPCPTCTTQPAGGRSQEFALEVGAAAGRRRRNGRADGLLGARGR